MIALYWILWLISGACLLFAGWLTGSRFWLWTIRVVTSIAFLYSSNAWLLFHFGGNYMNRFSVIYAMGMYFIVLKIIERMEDNAKKEKAGKELPAK